jgi:nucleotide-binding universal stress UspA family protein
MKILIATDGSEPARAAVEVGLELAAEQGAKLICITVAQRLDYGPALGFRFAPGAVVPHGATPADRTPLQAAARLAADRGIDMRAVIVAGNPVDQIAAYARSMGADLIVVGSRGHGPLARTVLGSVSRGLLRTAHCPVLVVRGPRHHCAAA